MHHARMCAKRIICATSSFCSSHWSAHVIRAPQPAESHPEHSASSASSASRARRIADPIELAGQLQGALIVGGGADPSSNQVSLAQDARLARDTLAELGQHATVLFGSGDTTLVQVANETPASPTLRRRLAEFFDPRDRDVHYDSVDFQIDGPGETESLLTLLQNVTERDRPLLLFIAGHGERGELPQDAIVRLWGDLPLTVHDLAETLGDMPARLVMTTCFGGGFASLAYLDGDPERQEELATNRCGFFATTWDREASGCDPNPERGQQLGYAMHFFHALRGRSRDGSQVTIDYDESGQISLLEAHTHARIAGRSFDVPTTTAEFYLRRVAEKNDAAVPFIEPEEQAVITQVGAELQLESAPAVIARLLALELLLVEHEEAVAVAQEHADFTYYALRIRLLERWPTLDDPWRDDFNTRLSEEADTIREALDESEAGIAYAGALTALEHIAGSYDELQMVLARVKTLARAYETAALAGSLRAARDERWQGYSNLRRCERGALAGSDH